MSEPNSDRVELLTFCSKKAASACSLKDDLQACSVTTLKGGEEISWPEIEPP